MSYKIIIADDEPILLSGIVHSCNWNDYGIEIVGQANNGIQVLELVEQFKPDIVITDIVMPLMNGITLIQKLNEYYPNIQVIVLSSFNEFNYVRESFKYGIKDYLLKPEVTPEILVNKIYTLCNKTNNFQTIENNNINYNIILQEYLENNKDNLQILKKYFNNKNYILLGFSINDIVSYNPANVSKIENDIKLYLKNNFEKSIYSYFMHKGYFICLINFDCVYDSLFNLIENFFHNIKVNYSNIKLFLSNTFYNIEDLQYNFKYIVNILTKRTYFESNIIPYQTNEYDNINLEFSNLKFLENLKNQNIYEAITMINDYYNLISKYKYMEDYALKRFTQNIVYTIINTLENLKIETNLSQEKFKIFRNIDISTSVEQLKNIVIETLEIFKDTTIKYNYTSPNLIDKVKFYIDNNYMYDINIRELASMLHINYTYLSTYFKSKTGESITSYINNKRINEAKKLLKNTDKFVSEISLEIGFSDHNYFSKVFKKITGLTPHDYRLK